MELYQLFTLASFVLWIIACQLLPSCNAKPTYYELEYDNNNDYDRYYQYDRAGNDNTYAVAYGKPLTEDRLKKLNTGYYYVDNGYIAPVPSSSHSSSASNRRREGEADFTDGLPDKVRFTPVLRYKQTQTKRKKLFVPNFFG